MKRARGELTLDQAVTLAVRGYWSTSTATISRLEAREDAPTDVRTRRLAWVLLTAYRYDPSDFDLEDTDQWPVQPPADAVNDRRSAKLRGRDSNSQPTGYRHALLHGIPDVAAA